MQCWIGEQILEKAADSLRPLAKRFACITEESLAERFRPQIEKLGLDITFFTFEGGEVSKTRKTKELLEDALLRAHFGRDCALIALGGGVVTDLGGFLASTFCRGVPLILIPTTLLAMVDAAIGGKNGVNTPAGKNLIGTYYLPQLLLIDLAFLKTLPPAEQKNGMAEVIKYGLIQESDLLLETNIQEIVQRSYQIKKRIVDADFHEAGMRRILNFGHTIGHAIEVVEHYQIPHGEAIATGMMVESLMSQTQGYLSEESCQTVIELLQKKGYLLTLPDIDRIWEAIAYDKKRVGATPRYVALKEIGAVHPFDGAYCTPFNKSHLEKVYEIACVSQSS